MEGWGNGQIVLALLVESRPENTGSIDGSIVMERQWVNLERVYNHCGTRSDTEYINDVKLRLPKASLSEDSDGKLRLVSKKHEKYIINMTAFLRNYQHPRSTLWRSPLSYLFLCDHRSKIRCQ